MLPSHGNGCPGPGQFLQHEIGPQKPWTARGVTSRWSPSIRSVGTETARSLQSGKFDAHEQCPELRTGLVRLRLIEP